MSVGPHIPFDDALRLEKLRRAVESELERCDKAVAEKRKEKDEYRNLRKRLEEQVKQLNHKIMIPIGSVGYLPGQIVHTNEVMVLLGENMFAERTVHQACQIIDRRTETLEEIIRSVQSEKRLINDQMKFASKLFEKSEERDEVEIREEYNEAEEEERKKKTVIKKRNVEELRASGPEKKQILVAKKPDAVIKTSTTASVVDKEFEKKMAILDRLEKEEERRERRGEEEEESGKKRKKKSSLSEDEEDAEKYSGDEDDDVGEEAVEKIDEGARRVVADVDEVLLDSMAAEANRPPPGVNPRDYAALVDRVNKMMEAESTDEEEYYSGSDTESERSSNDEDRLDSDDLPEDEQEEAKAAQSSVKKISEKKTDRLPAVEPKKVLGTQAKGKKTKQSRRVRFPSELESGPSSSATATAEDPTVSADSGSVKSILKNKEATPVDEVLLKEIEEAEQGPARSILPESKVAFPGEVVERQCCDVPSTSSGIVEKPARVSKFKQQRMQKNL